MTKRLAITIAGAVSLGSYEAGVLYEVLDAIQQHNSDARTTDDEKIEIDVMTGASAGGMTAAIVVQKILYEANKFVGPYDNPLYEAWVKRINMKDLLATKAGELALHSVLSSDLIEQISKDMLTARYTNPPQLEEEPHGAAAKKILLGFAITNLNGVDYGRPMRPEGQFIYTQHEDQFLAALDDKTDTLEAWEPIRNVAVACGAFPVAFRTKELERLRKDYENADTKHLEDWPATEAKRRFTYTDGGVLQNEPLGMAKNLVDTIDDHENNDSRFYLFVSPHGMGPTGDPGFREIDADYFHLAKRLVNTVLHQAEFQDWVNAEKMNDQIDLLDARVKELAQCVLDDKVDVASLQTTADSLLGMLPQQQPVGVVFQQQPNEAAGRVVAVQEGKSMEPAKRRVERKYRKELAMLGGRPDDENGLPAKARAWRDSTMAFERMANLGGHDYMKIYGMAAQDSVLAGAGLAAFVGFLDQKFRDHDYDRGRLVARSVLQNPTLAHEGELGPIYYTPKDTHPIDAQWNGLQPGNVPLEDQKMLRVGLERRVGQMLGELKLGVPKFLLSWLLVRAVMTRVFKRN